MLCGIAVREVPDPPADAPAPAKQRYARPSCARPQVQIALAAAVVDPAVARARAGARYKAQLCRHWVKRGCKYDDGCMYSPLVGIMDF